MKSTVDSVVIYFLASSNYNTQIKFNIFIMYDVVIWYACTLWKLFHHWLKHIHPFTRVLFLNSNIRTSLSSFPILGYLYYLLGTEDQRDMSDPAMLSCLQMTFTQCIKDNSQGSQSFYLLNHISWWLQLNLCVQYYSPLLPFLLEKQSFKHNQELHLTDRCPQ